MTVMAATERGVFIPVYKLMEQTGEPFDPKAYLPSVIGFFVTPDGHLLSLPFACSTPILYYNKEAFKNAGCHIALVRGKDRRLTGLVTLVDILEAIVGEIPSREDRLKPSVTKRADGTWLVDGTFDLVRLAHVLGVDVTILAEPECVTLADVVRQSLECNPVEGQTFHKAGFTFEVIDMDRHRVDKILISRHSTSFDL